MNSFKLLQEELQIGTRSLVANLVRQFPLFLKIAPNAGECLSCLGNTGGWHCDVCLPGYYGNPGDGFCKANLNVVFSLKENVLVPGLKP